MVNETRSRQLTEEKTGEGSSQGATADSESGQSESSVENLISALTAAVSKNVSKNNAKYIPKVPRNFSMGQNFKIWLSQFQQYAKLAQVPDEVMKDLMMTMLEPAAFRAVQLLRLESDMPFDQFTAKLGERFDSAKTTADYKIHFKHRKQNKTESFDDFADALLELADNAYANASLEFRDELAKDRFIEGVVVVDELREKLYLNQPKSLSEAVRMVRSLESARCSAASHNSRATQQKKMHCDAISGGSEKSELKELRELVASMKTKLESLEEKFENKPRKKLSEVKCYACQNMGHYASSCPGKGKVSGNEGRGLPRGSQSQ